MIPTDSTLQPTAASTAEVLPKEFFSGLLSETERARSYVLILCPETFPRLRSARSHGQSAQARRATGRWLANPYACSRARLAIEQIDQIFKPARRCQASMIPLRLVVDKKM